MTENIMIALKIMGQGMFGIFAAILLIMVITLAIQKVQKVFAGKS